MKVKMQGRIQKWVDHSISVTINLPNDVDEDLVNRLYVEAWKSGCKGCTVYRDGSRSGVLISTKSDKDKKEGLPPCKPPTVVEVRPRILEADVVRFQNNKEKWVAFVGLLDGHPYEIFTGLQDDDEGILLPKSVTCGRIIKMWMKTVPNVTTSNSRTNADIRRPLKDCQRSSTRNTGTMQN